MIKQLCGVALGALLALGALPALAAKAGFSTTTPAGASGCSYLSAVVSAIATDGSVEITCGGTASPKATFAFIPPNLTPPCPYDRVDIDPNGELKVTCGANTPPPAACALSADKITVSLTDPQFNLTANCLGATSYIWTGESCSEVTGKTCSVVPNKAASYGYTVQGKNDGGVGAVSSKVTVTVSSTSAPPPPAAAITCTLSANPNTVTVGDPFTLTATCSGATSYIYSWTGTGCVSQTNQCTVTSITTPDIYSYTVKASSGILSGSAPATVTVNAKATVAPTCTLTASPKAVPLKDSVTLTAHCTPSANSYAWTGSTNCTSTSRTCTDRPSKNTTYTVTGTNNIGPGTASKEVTVAVIPASEGPCLVIPDQQQINLGQEVTLTAACNPEPLALTWTGPGGCDGKTGVKCIAKPTEGGSAVYSVTATSGYVIVNAYAAVEVLAPSASSAKPVCQLTPASTTIPAGGEAVLTVSCHPEATSYTWVGAGCETVAAGGTTCTAKPGSKPETYPYKVSGINGNGTGIEATATVTVSSTSSGSCILSADKTTVSLAASQFTLTASCTPAATSYSWTGEGCKGLTGNTCTVAPTTANTYSYTVMNSSGGGVSPTVKVTVTPTTLATSYQGLWRNPSESGWGISLTQQTNKIFAAIYTYDAAGLPTWYSMSDCPILAAKAGSCTGDIYKVTGGSTPLVPWVGPVTAVSKGTGTFTFTDATSGKFDYKFTVDGAERSESIKKLEFANGTTKFETDYTDLWWKDEEGDPKKQEHGWGVALTQDQGMIFAAWYAYDDKGNPVWYTASSCPLTGTAPAGTCYGLLYRVTGGSPLQEMGLPSSHTWPVVTIPDTKDSVTFTFSDKDHGEMKYTIDGKEYFCKITRFGF